MFSQFEVQFPDYAIYVERPDYPLLVAQFQIRIISMPPSLFTNALLAEEVPVTTRKTSGELLELIVACGTARVNFPSKIHMSGRVDLMVLKTRRRQKTCLSG